MYTDYFGLTEKPFSIAPNPDYLFMSDRHREALANLTYGLGDTGGFVLLTGEVGTGKTTISRRLMEQLPENTQAAFILNPTLSSQELLATLCDELKIRYRKTGATLKTLTDKIQTKLLANHEQGINTLLIIDEAQHLKPEVLEQLRLLTNLETNTKKLLQVILIGQPELQMLLKRRDLRQLAQRITARYHLLPLTKPEVAQYIKHRLSVADCMRDLFTASAIAMVHKVCQGTPRLINLVCDRALINAYSSNNTLVNKKLVLQSAQEALDVDFHLAPVWQKLWFKSVLATIVVFSLIGTAYMFGQYQSYSDNTPTAANLAGEEQIVSLPINESKNESRIEDEKVDKVRAPAEVLADVPAIEAKTVVYKPEQDSETLTVNVKGNEQPIAKLPTDEIIPSSHITNAAPSAADNKDALTNMQVNSVEGVSEELLTKFQLAIDASAQAEEAAAIEGQIEPDYLPLSDMPQWVQKGVPQLEFDMHIYASDGDGWVRVNGRDRYEGDYIEQDLLLSEILPQSVVLNFRGEKFTLPALSSW